MGHNTGTNNIFFISEWTTTLLKTQPIRNTRTRRSISNLAIFLLKPSCATNLVRLDFVDMEQNVALPMEHMSYKKMHVRKTTDVGRRSSARTTTATLLVLMESVVISFTTNRRNN